MRIKNPAIVVHQLQKWGGLEYELKVVSSIFDKCTIYTAWYDKEFADEHFRDSKIEASFLQFFPLKKKLDKQLIPLHPYAYSSLDLSEHDLIIVISDSFEKLVKFSTSVPSILIFLTPPRFLWMDTRSSEKLRTISYRIYGALLRKPLHKVWSRWDKEAVARYDHLISISNEVRSRVAKVYDRSSDVIYPPVEVNSFKFNRNTQNREEWYLYFGRVETYKGVELAIRAAAEGGFRLKVAGSGSDLERMKKLVEVMGIRHQVGFLGFVSEKQKKELLYKCKALIYPVKDEDFGIIPVEANASGAPVIAYAGGGALETVVDGETGVFFNEYSHTSLKEKIFQFEKMSFDANRCRTNAMQFSRDIFENKVRTFLRGINKG